MSFKDFQSVKSSHRDEHGSQAHLAYLNHHVDYLNPDFCRTHDEVKKNFMNPHNSTKMNKAGGNGDKKLS